jgi:hypothetical protein
MIATEANAEQLSITVKLRLRQHLHQMQTGTVCVFITTAKRVTIAVILCVHTEV